MRACGVHASLRALAAAHPVSHRLPSANIHPGRVMQTSLVRLFVVVGALGLATADAVAGTATKVSVGNRHACAVTAAGGAVCWGDNTWNQLGDGTTTSRATPAPVSGLSSGVTAIAAGDTHTCALTSAGAVLCWGENSAGQVGDSTTTQRATPTPVNGLSSGVTAIAAGGAHSCAVAAGGALKCWGYNYYGQLGDTTKVDRLTPVAVSTLSTGVTAVSAGLYFTCALKTGGAMVCWGRNDYGQLGNNTVTDSASPVSVSSLSSGAAAIGTGSAHSCAVTTTGAMSCWGYNGVGQLGDTTKVAKRVPTAVSGMSAGVATVGLGQAHTCAVTTVGALKCWGDNQYGEIGDGTMTERVTPTQVSGLTSGIATVSGGGFETCALSTSGEIRCWGTNEFSQLGVGILVLARRTTPWPVTGLGSGLATVGAGARHTCGLTTTGAVKCWGSNQFGQLGDGSTFPVDRPVPATVSGLGSGVAAIAVGGYHACALTTGGAVKCWGQNVVGQLGDNSVVNRPTPVQVSGLTTGVAAITAGDSHTCALTTAGAVKCWGANWYGQIGDNTTTDKRVPTQVSGMTSGVAGVSVWGYHTCAKTTAGAAKCWGYNSMGQLGDNSTTQRPTPTQVYGLTTGVLAVAAGWEHSCALLSGGAVKCWGGNNQGQVGDGTSFNRWVPTAVSGLESGVASLAVGISHACAVTSGGGLWCWGMNAEAQLGDGTTTNRNAPTAVAGLASGVATASGGSQHTCAVTTDGAGLCWGWNDNGMLGDGMWKTILAPTMVYGLGGALSLSGIDPVTGPPGGGTSVRIAGSNMIDGATVTLGGVAATGVTVINPSEIAATTGAHAAGAVSVVVRNPDATEATLAAGFTYSGGASSPTFTDQPLVARTTPVKAVHVTELRGYVNDLRVRYGLSAFSWTNGALAQGVTPVRAIDVAELRTALEAAYVAATRTPPTYTDPTLTPGVTVVTATHIAELRAAVLALW
jgi:alpha-tubulin suppressor-like RCC1 family protein